MEFQDKTLTCRDCRQTFVFTTGEQGFYVEKGLMNEPQRCPTCRANRRNNRGGSSPSAASTITCAQCGKEATVPFVPRLDRPVYCGECFGALRADKTPVGA
jgi:CxxC-x17-CxxC domain-containing protein